MPYFLETYPGKRAIVVNSKTGKHSSLSPIPMANAKAQMRILNGAMKKKEERK